MNLLLVPSLQSCEFIFFTDIKICESLTLETSKSFSETIIASEYWKEVDSIYFVSGPASFTTLRNMSVFLETLQQFSEKAQNKKYNFYNISTAKILENLSSNISNNLPTLIYLYSVGKREVFLFEEQQYTKIKNKNLLEYILNTVSHKKIKIFGFLSENICKIFDDNNHHDDHVEYINFENNISQFLNIEKLITLMSEENIINNSSDMSIDYGALPMLNPPGRDK